MASGAPRSHRRARTGQDPDRRWPRSTGRSGVPWSAEEPQWMPARQPSFSALSRPWSRAQPWSCQKFEHRRHLRAGPSLSRQRLPFRSSEYGLRCAPGSRRAGRMGCLYPHWKAFIPALSPGPSGCLFRIASSRSPMRRLRWSSAVMAGPDPVLAPSVSRSRRSRYPRR